MAIAILDISSNRVVFANSDFRALLQEALLPLDLFIKIVVSVAGSDSTTLSPIVAEKIRDRIGQKVQGTVERIRALHYIPVGEDLGHQCIMVVERREEVRDDLGSRSLSQNYLDLALRASGLGAWSLDLNADNADRTHLHDGIFGYTSPAPNWNLDIFLSHVHEDDVEGVRRAFEDAANKRVEWKFSCRIRRLDGAVRWIEATGHPYGPGDHTATHYIGIVRDITDDVNAEEQRRMLFAELHHRVRNNLSIVQSLISNTLVNSLDPNQASLALRKRILALSRAHDVLTSSSQEPLTLFTVFGLTISETIGNCGVNLRGADILVPFHHVVPLSMWLAELVARSSHNRSLDVANNCETGEIILSWTDSGGDEHCWQDQFASTLVFRSLPSQLGGEVTETGIASNFQIKMVLPDFYKQPSLSGEQRFTATAVMSR